MTPLLNLETWHDIVQGAKGITRARAVCRVHRNAGHLLYLRDLCDGRGRRGDAPSNASPVFGRVCVSAVVQGPCPLARLGTCDAIADAGDSGVRDNTDTRTRRARAVSLEPYGKRMLKPKRNACTMLHFALHIF